MTERESFFDRPFGVGSYPQRFFDFFHWGAFAEPLIWGVFYGIWPVAFLALVAQGIPYLVSYGILQLTSVDYANSLTVVFAVTAFAELVAGIVRLWAGMNANRLLWKRESVVIAMVRKGAPRWTFAYVLSRQRLWARVTMAIYVISFFVMAYVNYLMMLETSEIVAMFAAAHTIVWALAILIAAHWISLKGSVYMDPRRGFSLRPGEGARDIEGARELLEQYRESGPPVEGRKEKAKQVLQGILLKDDDYNGDSDVVAAEAFDRASNQDSPRRGPAIKHYEGPILTLSNGEQIPQLGFGTYKSAAGEEVERAVSYALKAGYRHIDTASMYGNEASIGKAIKASGISRDELFITSKVWNDQQGYIKTVTALEETLIDLQTDYVDLYLVHWPIERKLESTWRALEHLMLAGKVRSIGVCNFDVPHLEALEQVSQVNPMVNQIELHPRNSRTHLVNYCQARGMVVQAWAPLMRSGVFEIEELVAIGKKYQKTAGQVSLRWALQRGLVVLPKSVMEPRIIENAQIFDFELKQVDMDLIDSLNKDYRIGPSPETYSWEWPKSSR